ncbi:MAG: DUF1326 domain-containing protein [Planctomycetota bacterium]|nr:MAG: DUF1326 domain-containing protein [Planctomycetota bacterium]
MARWLTLAAIALILAAAPVSAAGITGQYIEARTCDVWTGPCFANAEMNLGGKHAVMGWKVDKGALDNVRLDGLSVVAVVTASDTLGLEQTGPSSAVLIVDSKANKAQREALVNFAKKQGGDLLKKIIKVETAKVELDTTGCTEGGCAHLQAGQASIKTRCLDGHHDKVCGNEVNFYPPIAKNVDAKAAVATRHAYTGAGFNETWKDSERRGAYVGSFEMK